MHNIFLHTAKEIVGMRLKILRQKRNMTLQQLADKINSDRQYVWNIENGDVNLTLDYIDRIAHALNISQSEFLNTDV
ncbi:MAG: helix-turn-helix transcriptional regulator [Bacteroidetes bacterium]|nr:helix-turn-helix transcriptional regulator [Bacteroidota bacterium]